MNEVQKALVRGLAEADPYNELQLCAVGCIGIGDGAAVT